MLLLNNNFFNMKTNYILKTCIDILFFLMLFGILGFIFMMPFGMFTSNIGNVTLESYDDYLNLPIMYWFAVIVAILTYVCMLIGIWFLRKSSAQFLDNDLLKLSVSANLNKSGMCFIISAVGVTGCYVAIWLADFNPKSISLTIGNNIFIPLFLAIVGLFFKIVANTISNAKLIKEENDLTI